MILATIEYDGELSLAAWLILFGILGFIFGTLGWGIYRAMKAVRQQEAAPAALSKEK